MTTATAEAPSAMSLLAGMAAAAPPKKKGSDKPEFTDAALTPHIDALIKAKAEKDSAEASIVAAEDQILTIAKQRRIEHCQRTQKAESSIVVNGRLTVSVANKYSPVPQEAEPELRLAFGPQYERYFKSALSIGLTEGAAADETVLKTLVEKLGQEFIAQNFVIGRKLTVTETLHTDLATNKETAKIAEPFIQNETIKCYKPSVKVK